MYESFESLLQDDWAMTESKKIAQIILIVVRNIAILGYSHWPTNLLFQQTQ
jgi:hypothetical protein